MKDMGLQMLYVCSEADSICRKDYLTLSTSHLDLGFLRSYILCTFSSLYVEDNFI